ncbi:MAG TPA: hypothetical protein VF179_01065 [Thermoanaerobaculia bacterium]|nr:hypothetical protein [Thermoanaerobaculia bacterium]
MEHAAFQDPALTIPLAAAGMLAQTVARAVVEGQCQEITAGLLEAGWSESKR